MGWRPRRSCILGLLIVGLMVHLSRLLLRGPPSIDSRFVGDAVMLDDYNAEIHRLDAFFEEKESVCQVRDTIGNFPVCIKSEGRTFRSAGNLTVVSVESKDLSFEEQLAKQGNKVQVFVLSSDEPVSPQHQNVHISLVPPVLTSLPFLGPYIWLQQLHAMVEHATHGPIDILKLGSLGNTPMQPWVIFSLLDNSLLPRVQQLHLVVDIGGLSSQGIFDWYRALVALRDNAHFSLYHAELHNKSTNGAVWITSWMSEVTNNGDDNVKAVEASEDIIAEEVLGEISKPSPVCMNVVNVAVSQIKEVADLLVNKRRETWPVCVERLTNSCVVYSARIQGNDWNFEKLLASKGCQVFVFDPFYNESIGAVPDNVNVLQYAIGPSTSNFVIAHGTTNNSVNFRSLNEVMAELGHNRSGIDLLKLDLQGGEWMILSSLVRTGSIHNFRQIVSGVHVWFGEERGHLLTYKKVLADLKSAGFVSFSSKSLSKENNDNSSLPLVWKCCFTVGWIHQ